MPFGVSRVRGGLGVGWAVFCAPTSASRRWRRRCLGASYLQLDLRYGAGFSADAVELVGLCTAVIAGLVFSFVFFLQFVAVVFALSGLAACSSFSPLVPAEQEQVAAAQHLTVTSSIKSGYLSEPICEQLGGLFDCPEVQRVHALSSPLCRWQAHQVPKVAATRSVQVSQEWKQYLILDLMASIQVRLGAGILEFVMRPIGKAWAA